MAKKIAAAVDDEGPEEDEGTPKHPPVADPTAPAPRPRAVSQRCPSCDGGLKSLERGKKWYCEDEDLIVDPVGDARPSTIGARLEALEAKMTPLEWIAETFTGKKLEDVTVQDLPQLPAGFLDSIGSSVMGLFGGGAPTIDVPPAKKK